MKRRRIPIWSEAKATQPREFEIRAIRPNEVHAAASMHFEFLGGPEVARCSFLKLGFKFLEAFYRLNLDNPYFFALGAFMRGDVPLPCGFPSPAHPIRPISDRQVER